MWKIFNHCLNRYCFAKNPNENVPATDSGRGFHILVWRSYEEPLQTSCLGKKALVLLCFRSKMVKKHWFYCVFAPKVKKALVLLCFRSKMLKNHWFYKQRCRKTWKTIGFTVKRAPGHRKTNPGPPGHGSGVWSSPTRKDKLWGTLTDKLFREKTIGFTVKNFKKEQKPL